MLVGIHVAKGNPSKIFSPFLLPKNLKASSENIKDKLLVNFDPLRCYIADLQASDLICFEIALLSSILLLTLLHLYENVERILQHFQLMV